MNFFKKIFGVNKSITQQEKEKLSKNSINNSNVVPFIKTMLKESSGALDFVKRAKEAGFRVTEVAAYGTTIEGFDCMLMMSVLASKGKDKIWCLTVKKGNDPSINLIDEGSFRF